MLCSLKIASSVKPVQSSVKQFSQLSALPPLLSLRPLTFMLLVGRIVHPHWDQDEEDEQGPDYLNQQLDLRREDRQGDN